MLAPKEGGKSCTKVTCFYFRAYSPLSIMGFNLTTIERE